ncbi:MAG: F0F1 ATP synthase subunit A [Planctomycetota bacterium]|jgi:F-type H+-transporting ATPase subunit a
MTMHLPLLADALDHVLPHELWKVGEYSFTNHVLMLIVSAVLLVIFLPIAARAPSVVPTGFRNFLEAILQFIREEVARPVLGQNTDKFIPYIWTFFFLILTANLLGMIPLGSFAAPIDAHLSHIGGTATGNLSITAGLAICAFFLIHIAGIREQGFTHYCKNFVPSVPWPLLILFIPLEILGAFVKPFALAMRLFANMLAGHIVLAVILGFAATGLHMGGGGYGITLVSVVGGVALSLLEVFVAFLQAYIFTFLTTLFIGMAVHPEH